MHLDEKEVFIKVEVLNVVPINQLHKVIPETISETPLIDENDWYKDWGTYDIGDSEHLIERSWTADGYLGDVQYIYKDKNGIYHDIMHFWWDSDDEYFYICNVVDNDKK